MNEELEEQGEGVTAAHIVGGVVDTMALYNVPVTGRAKGMLGKQAKDLLADGFDPPDVLLACVIALRRGQPHVAHFIAQDIVLARAGQRTTRQQYDRELARMEDELHPRNDLLARVLREERERREAGR